MRKLGSLSPFYSVLDPSHDTVLPIARVVLSILRHAIWKILHRHARRLVSEVILDPLKLTPETSPARFLPLAVLLALCSESPRKSPTELHLQTLDIFKAISSRPPGFFYKRQQLCSSGTTFLW